METLLIYHNDLCFVTNIITIHFVNNLGLAINDCYSILNIGIQVYQLHEIKSMNYNLTTIEIWCAYILWHNGSHLDYCIKITTLFNKFTSVKQLL